jgi:hypothetical protein
MLVDRGEGFGFVDKFEQLPAFSAQGLGGGGGIAGIDFARLRFGANR